MGGIVCLWVFEDKEQSWSDNARFITQVAKHRPDKERYQSRRRLHGRRKFPEHSGRGRPGAGALTDPDELAGGCAAGGSVSAVGDVVDDGGETSRLSAEDSGERDALMPWSEGSSGVRRRRRRRCALERSWPLGPWMLFFRAHSIRESGERRRMPCPWGP